MGQTLEKLLKQCSTRKTQGIPRTLLSPVWPWDRWPELHVVERVVFSGSEATDPQRLWFQTITFSPKHLPSFNGETLFYSWYLRTWWKTPRARPQDATGSAKDVPGFDNELFLLHEWGAKKKALLAQFNPQYHGVFFCKQLSSGLILPIWQTMIFSRRKTGSIWHIMP